MDLVEFKEQQKAAWSTFAVLEAATATTAPRLVRHARVEKGQRVLDVACGTGVVALTAARLGATVTGLDLTPALVAHARENAALIRLDVSWHEGDVEALPFADASFDVVVSQFGHMFAPRPEVAVREMLRVLEPGGTIAFSTWPPEMFVGRMFRALAKHQPPPPAFVASPILWGEPKVVEERLGSAVRDVTFARDFMRLPSLSAQHYRAFMEKHFAHAAKLFERLDATEPARATELRRELEALATEYFEDNTIRQDFLVTRATKV